jgi:hypothetical protein
MTMSPQIVVALNVGATPPRRRLARNGWKPMDTTDPGTGVTATSNESGDGPAPTAIGVDPNATVCPSMRIVGQAGGAIGEIESLERDPASGLLRSLVVRHGVFGQRHTSLRPEQIDHVEADTLVLRLSYDDFKRIPTIEGR